MKKYYYKDFLFDAILYQHRDFVYLVPKSTTFYMRLISMLESLIADHPQKRKIYSSIVLSNTEIKKTQGSCPSPYLAKKHYKCIEFVYDSSLEYSTESFWNSEQLHSLDIRVEENKVIYRFDEWVIDSLKKEIQDYDMGNPYWEGSFTHWWLMYCPSCWF